MIRLNTRAKGGRISRSSYSYVAIFFGGVLLYLAAVLPFLIYHRGIFFYYGDYNVQQVPFYLLAHRAVRNGNLFWNSHVDLLPVGKSVLLVLLSLPGDVDPVHAPRL